MSFQSLPTSPECRLSSRTAKGLGASLGGIKGSSAADWHHHHNANNKQSVVSSGGGGGGNNNNNRKTLPSSASIRPLSDYQLRQQGNNNNSTSPRQSSSPPATNHTDNTTTTTSTNYRYYPVSPREYCSPETVRMSELESSQLSQSQRIKTALYGDVRSIVGNSKNATSSNNRNSSSPKSYHQKPNSMDPWSPSSSVLLGSNTLASSAASYGTTLPTTTTTCNLHPHTSSSPLHAITSATDAKIRPLFNSSGESVRRVLTAINKEAARKRGRRVVPPVLAPPPPLQRNKNAPTEGNHHRDRDGSSPSPLNHHKNNASDEIGGFGRVNGVYVPHPHSVLLPWWIPKVTISDAVRCAQSTLGRELTLHEVNYMRQRRGEDPLDEGGVKLLLSGRGGGGGGGGQQQKPSSSSSPSRGTTTTKGNSAAKKKSSSSLSPSPPSTPRDRNILRYNVHAQGPTYPPQVLYIGRGGGVAAYSSSSSSPLSPHNDNNNNNTVGVGEAGVVSIPCAHSPSQPHSPILSSPPPTPQHHQDNEEDANGTNNSSSRRRRGSDLVIDCRLKAQLDDVTGAMRMLSQQ